MGRRAFSLNWELCSWEKADRLRVKKDSASVESTVPLLTNDDIIEPTTPKNLFSHSAGALVVVLQSTIVLLTILKHWQLAKPLIISVSLRWTSWHGFIGCMGLQNLCYCLLRDCICRSCHCSRLAVSIIGKTDDRNITNLQTISLCDAPISDSRVGEMAEMHSGATGQFREEEEEGCCQANPANWHFFIVKIITFSRVLDFHVARQ